MDLDEILQKNYQLKMKQLSKREAHLPHYYVTRAKTKKMKANKGSVINLYVYVAH